MWLTIKDKWLNYSHCFNHKKNFPSTLKTTIHKVDSLSKFTKTVEFPCLTVRKPFLLYETTI